MGFSICEAVLIQTLAFHPWVASLQLLTNLNPTVSITSLLSVSPIFQTLIPNCNPIVNRVAKCHGYGGYIRVKKLEGWGKKSGRIHSFAKSSIVLGKFEQLI